MAKAAILVPYLDMCEMAQTLVDEFPELTPMCVEYTRTDQIESRARELAAQGCELIVARGVQASIVKHSVKIPVVEIVVTTQELGALVLELHRELGLERPRIGLLGFANMMGDTTRFDELFGIELKCYMVSSSLELPARVEEALRDGCRAVIGGDIVCQNAQRRGLPFRFIPSGIESLRTALSTAARVGYAIDLEKQNSAEMDAMLNNTFSGIMQLDSAGCVCRMNRAACDLLEVAPGQLQGQEVSSVLPAMKRSVLDDALLLGRESYAFVMDVRSRVVMVNVAPIRVGEAITGAILTFQEGQRIIEMDSELRRELYQRGYIAKYTFDKIEPHTHEGQETVELAKRIAKYPAPILITGENGTGKDMLAQCIHNESMFRNNAFVPLDCSAWLPETLDTMLFGNYTTRKDTNACMAELAQDGTLYLSHIEELPFEAQYKILNLIRSKFLHNGSNRPISTNVRVIASSTASLASRVERGEFRSDLFYALSALSLDLLPLRRRREEILGWVEFYLDEWQEQYKRYVHLTQGAMQFLQRYDWPGNLSQLSSVCERIVLLTEKRSIDEVFLRRQLEQVTPKTMPDSDRAVIYRDERGIEIAELLRRYGGNRERVAAELGISKTTLWRHMKKYGIGQDFHY